MPADVSPPLLPSPPPGTAGRRLAFALALAALAAIALRLAWVGDDAYITLRSVENWCTGHGLTWNTAERVQTYTHPAWMLLLAAGRAVSGEVYFTTLAISLVLSLTAIALLLRAAGTVPALIATAAVLAGTRAFGEYATSGLETPLTYLLLVLLVAERHAARAPLPHYRRIVLLSALLATNRMDLALLCLPVALAALRGVRWRDALVHGVLASLPFLAWVAFAWLWYGTPLPITAHAKAFGPAIPAAEMLAQGLRYTLFALRDDPVLVPAVLFGIGVGLARAGTRALALGALLYCGYVLRIGGDFMAGRFFLPPFVVAVAIVARWLAEGRTRVAWTLVAVVAALVAVRGVPVWLTPPSSERGTTPAEVEAEHGISDERRAYYRRLGLLAPGRFLPVPGALEALVFPEGRRERWCSLSGAVGIAGYEAGPRAHLVDPLLCDPLLARLPARGPNDWRIGHVLRRIPEGYWESVLTGENRILHPGLREYYEVLRTAMRGPVLGGERLAAVAQLALGSADGGLRAFVAEHYFTPPRVPVAAAAVDEPLPPAVFWFDEPRMQLVYDGGVAVQWPTGQHAGSLRVQVLGLWDFRYRLVRGGAVVADRLVAQAPLRGELRADLGLREDLLPFDGAVSFDTLWIDPVENALTHTSPGPAAIGAVLLAR